ncbi:DUF6503 family protein [Algoriphagus machipongonensis]|uniref:Lipoprotein n=1 Tax=Algoriphagus machipongonensis TaxID=388413 RepID=A3HS99_9BACT|nr:DUF6503 family protein [Algoriphagus machipongonensis]EAZ82717.1 hypothetical protein ALPR1_10890 [Algoriphagus machipongonensis]
MKISILFLFCGLFLYSCGEGEKKAPETGSELVSQSIQFHDPNGIWSSLDATFVIEDSLPPGRDSRSYFFSLDNSRSFLSYSIEGLEFEVENDSVKVLNGEMAEERALRMRNYYSYLWGLPMKLADPGTEIEKEIQEEVLNGKTYLVARVPYEKDVWYFYFDPETYAMEAYKFYQDEANLKGEIIYLEGLVNYKGLKIPANRTWYRTEIDEFLATDMLQEIK